ncbi:hypothetical protein EST38_g9440 [Candolleomyces aberdarensis]|uniref:Calpain catalytic domain-containing protein n=1 Tax=Candolleomyces aberdarensis TaxID=2316362 RepID=A0A4Q2D9W5_9AGAR|nr:hypothetical protein EST38_g9440 [Candolleomyces aberdarensis]
MQRTEGSEIADAEANYAKATRAELSRRFNEAFKHYIKAAELFLHLSRSPKSTEKDKAKWKSNAQKALDRAEKIKAFTEKSPKQVGSPTERVPSELDPTADVRLAPVAIDHFALLGQDEQYYVLNKGKLVNGLNLPLWDESTGAPGEGLFVDPDGQPALSPEQKAVSAFWRRLDIQPTGKIEPAQILPQDILQHVVTDCSVCASVSVCLEHSSRFGTHVAETPLHHYCDAENSSEPQAVDTPKLFWVEKHGRLDFKFLFNGAWRRVVIDDQLPYDPQKGTLMCMSTLSSLSSQSTLWPSLLEKAYMKLMGGYDFPGSNSCIDLHAIAGWIPEHIEIRRSTFERERTWERVSSGFLSGRCMLTLGTGPNPASIDEKIRLLPSHSYAVTDVAEREEGRTVTILDSWVCPDTEPEDQSRMLTIPWADALNMFDGIYLSWDPEMWTHSLTFHGMWKRNDPEDVSKRLFLTFTNGSSTDEEVWVLLTRHTPDTRRTQDFIALRVQVEDEMHVMPASLARQPLCNKETYTNSTHILVRTRLSCTEHAGILAILASYDGDASEVGFTVSVYSSKHVDIQWNETVVTPLLTTKVSGTITHKTAGGNCTHRSFMVNPQYLLRISSPRNTLGSNSGAKARTNFTLQTSKDTPVNVAVVWSQGKRVTDLSERDLIASSGAYTYGSARVSKDMTRRSPSHSPFAPTVRETARLIYRYRISLAGDSTIVVSAFNPQYLGPFSLKVECSLPFDLTPIPQEGAGMYSKTIRGSWERHNAGGSPGFSSYSKNPKFELDVPSLSECMYALSSTRSFRIAFWHVHLFLTPIAYDYN